MSHMNLEAALARFAELFEHFSTSIHDVRELLTPLIERPWQEYFGAESPSFGRELDEANLAVLDRYLKILTLLMEVRLRAVPAGENGEPATRALMRAEAEARLMSIYDRMRRLRSRLDKAPQQKSPPPSLSLQMQMEPARESSPITPPPPAMEPDLETVLTEPIPTVAIPTEPIPTEAILPEPILPEPILPEPIFLEPLTTNAEEVEQTFAHYSAKHHPVTVPLSAESEAAEGEPEFIMEPEPNEAGVAPVHQDSQENEPGWGSAFPDEAETSPVDDALAVEEALIFAAAQVLEAGPADEGKPAPSVKPPSAPRPSMTATPNMQSPIPQETVPVAAPGPVEPAIVTHLRLVEIDPMQPLLEQARQFRQVHADPADLRIKTPQRTWTLSLPYYLLPQGGSPQRLLDVENFIAIQQMAFRGILDAAARAGSDADPAVAPMIEKLHRFLVHLYGNIHLVIAPHGMKILPEVGESIDADLLLLFETDLHLNPWRTSEDAQIFRSLFVKHVADPFAEWLAQADNRLTYMNSILPAAGRA